MKTDTLERSKVMLPKGFTMRSATLEDVEAAVKLFNRWSESVIHEVEFTDEAAIRMEWVSPGFTPAEDIWLVFAANGELVGYIEVWTTQKPPVHPWIWGRVDPRYEGLGIGTPLLTWAEERALTALDEVPADLRFSPRVGTYREAEAAKKLFEDMGYRRIRSSYQMQIQMETPFEEGLKRFKHFMTGYEGFDPTLWFLAMDGDEIAGICLCRRQAHNDPNVGWVNTLGVRRAWRNRGIGLALLRHAFGEFYRRGKRIAGLGVDAENLTGALRLYQNAGMYVHRAFDLFEKEVRPGREISVQSL